jgi:transposase InsO family protein
MLSIRHIRTRPYTPKTNGKAERFIQMSPSQPQPRLRTY